MDVNTKLPITIFGTSTSKHYVGYYWLNYYNVTAIDE